MVFGNDLKPTSPATGTSWVFSAIKLGFKSKMSQFSNVLIISACNDIVCQYKKKKQNKKWVVESGLEGETSVLNFCIKNFILIS